MNESQKIICKIILKMLEIEGFKEKIDTPGYNYIFSQIIRQYAEINNKYEKTWKNISLCKDHHKFTERAVKILNENINVKDDTIWKELHYEHIVPVKVIKARLKNLKGKNLNFNKVSESMKDNEVIIMTKEEAHVLDGREDKCYPLEGEDVCGKGLKSKGTKESRLGAINAKIHNKYKNNSITS